MEEKKLTPAMKQYMDIKVKYPDAILLFRMGDFYETFLQDAKDFSEILSVSLTTRAGYPLAGIPYHSLDQYLEKLIKSGRKIAICEQVEDPKQAKGIVKREVTQVITPGVIVETNYLSGGVNNYVMSYLICGKELSVAFCDISTGVLLATSVLGETEDILYKTIKEEIVRFSPKEILTLESEIQNATYKRLESEYPNIYYSSVLDYAAEETYARTNLKEHFKTASLKGYGIEDKKGVISVSSMLIHYIKEMQKTSLSNIQGITFYNREDHMILDEATWSHLELLNSMNDDSYTLISVLDETKTNMGSRLMRRIIVEPLIKSESINERLKNVEYFCDKIDTTENIREKLQKINDIERISSKLAFMRINPKELVSLKVSLINSLEIMANLAVSGFELANTEHIENIRIVIDLIERAILEEPSMSINEGNVIKDSYDPTLLKYNEARAEGRNWIAELEYKLRDETGINNLRIRYNNVIGYYIEVTKSYIKHVPSNFIKRQTLVGNERYTTEKLLEYEKIINEANEKGYSKEASIFMAVRSQAAKHVASIMHIANIISWIDVYSSLAHLAVDKNYVKPIVDNSDIIEIKNGRHPVVEKYLTNNSFIPNDVYIDKNERLLIITGPNMSGKSTYLRQIALITLLAQIGSFVPADSARIGVVDRIFTRVGANDNISRGESTFLVEMSESANILNNCTSKSLVIMDEIGRGTSTYDGMSIAWAIIEYLITNKDRRAKTLFATHYHELTLLEKLEGVKNYSILVEEHRNEIIFMKKVVPGAAKSSYGIYVARLAGIPIEVTNRAKEILIQLEEDGSVQVNALEKTSAAKKREDTLPLFDYEKKESEIEKEIDCLDVNNITPMEAMSLISKWKDLLDK